MLAELLARRGQARLGLHVRDGDVLHDHALVAVATIYHLSLFFLRATWCGAAGGGGRAGCADAGGAGTGWGGAVALCERWRMI